MRLSLCAALLLASILPLPAAPEQKLDPKQVSFFEKRVRPVLVKQCYQCHSAEKKVKGGLRLDTREAVLRGGDSGPVIVPGNPKKSLLIIAINHSDDDLKMPEKKKLSEREIGDLTKWVAMGAPDPRVEESEPYLAAVIDYEAGRKFWAFTPPVKRPAPAVQNKSWPHNEVDRHLLAMMESKGLAPVGDADKRTLVRRLYFDLIGLPPTAQQIDAFLEDSSPRAVAKLVDQLLASPQYGERWGRHWLDVARYSESNGMERNFTYPHAWRYRDYVIASFNKDKPYDQFIREQLSGDLLDDKEAPGTIAEERLTATGFLALGPKILNERDKIVFQMEMVDEQIDASTRAVLGLTVSCARCHDHKFDPIGMKDYYALAGIFTSTRTLYGTKGGGGNRQATELMAIGDETPQQKSEREEYKKKLTASQKRLGQMTKQFQNLKKQATRVKGNAPRKSAMEKRMTDTRGKMDDLKKEVAKLRKDAPPAPNFAMGVSERAAPGNCKICLRGDAKKRGPVVERGFLQVMSSKSTPAIDEDSSGRRELALWMTRRENPLAARVMVNRIWHHLFGVGLVRTVDNFGKMGEEPVNQALLDYLAVRFMEENWSVKKMIRELTLSHAYQLGGHHHDKNYRIDPENRFCWQMTHRRLDAEAIRDAILHASGELELEPFQGSVVQLLGDVNFGRNVSDLGKKSEAVANHRSVYLPIIRNAVPEGLRVFDFAEPSLIVGRRAITTVPTQALYLLNDPFVLEHTELMAQRVLDGATDDGRRVDLAYILTLSRPATTLERERSLALVKEIRAGLDTKDDADRERLAWATLAQSLVGTAEFRYLD
jgi:cytochrome c553